jgi:hypothetical protein
LGGDDSPSDFTDDDEPAEESDNIAEAVIQSKFQKLNFAEIQNIEEIENKPAFERKGIKLSFDIPKDAKRYPLAEE